MLGFHAECCIPKEVIIAPRHSNHSPQWLLAKACDRAWGLERPASLDVLPKTNPCDFLDGPIRLKKLMETSR